MPRRRPIQLFDGSKVHHGPIHTPRRDVTPNTKALVDTLKRSFFQLQCELVGVQACTLAAGLLASGVDYTSEQDRPLIKRLVRDTRKLFVGLRYMEE